MGLLKGKVWCRFFNTLWKFWVLGEPFFYITGRDTIHFKRGSPFDFELSSKVQGIRFNIWENEWFLIRNLTEFERVKNERSWGKHRNNPGCANFWRNKENPVWAVWGRICSQEPKNFHQYENHRGNGVSGLFKRKKKSQEC